MNSTAQNHRILQTTIAEMAETESAAVEAWRKVNALRHHSRGLLAMNRVALIEMRDWLDDMITATGREL